MIKSLLIQNNNNIKIFYNNKILKGRFFSTIHVGVTHVRYRDIVARGGRVARSRGAITRGTRAIFSGMTRQCRVVGSCLLCREWTALYRMLVANIS